jgi:hypothetical protein
MDQVSKPSDYIPVADVEVSSVKLQKRGFLLEGLGQDRADYKIELDLEVPVDQRTRSVLGELLSQSRWRISRRVPQPIRGSTRPVRRAEKPSAG